MVWYGCNVKSLLTYSQLYVCHVVSCHVVSCHVIVLKEWNGMEWRSKNGIHSFRRYNRFDALFLILFFIDMSHFCLFQYN